MNISYTLLRDEDYCPYEKNGKEPKTKYIGCIGVKESMRTMSHRTRSEVAKISIDRLSSNNFKKKIETNRLLDDEPNLLNSGIDVELCVTSTHLKLISKENQQIIIQHEMPNVSFASSGDEDTKDFVAYVAKDAKFGRACFVLECGHESAKNVLEAIARGFSLRTQILSQTSTLPRYSSTDRSPNLNNTHYLTETKENGNIENQRDEEVIADTRLALEKEPWYHGSGLSREESETRLKSDGDFLVRESLQDPGHFVLSVMYNNNKLHLLFDSMNQVRTKEMCFNNISHLVKYHHDKNFPLVAEERIVFLLNGVRPDNERKE